MTRRTIEISRLQRPDTRQSQHTEQGQQGAPDYDAGYYPEQEMFRWNAESQTHYRPQRRPGDERRQQSQPDNAYRRHILCVRPCRPFLSSMPYFLMNQARIRSPSKTIITTPVVAPTTAVAPMTAGFMPITKPVGTATQSSMIPMPNTARTFDVIVFP